MIKFISSWKFKQTTGAENWSGSGSRQDSLPEFYHIASRVGGTITSTTTIIKAMGRMKERFNKFFHSSFRRK